MGLVAREGSPADSAAVLSRLLSPCLRSSFNSADNRSEFARDEAAYADRYGLSAEQKRVLLGRDFLAMIRMGANIYYVAKLAIPSGVSVQDAGAAFQGITTEEFKAKLAVRGEGLEERLAREGGYWHG